MKRDLARRIMALFLSLCMMAGMIDLTGFASRAEDAPKKSIRDCPINGGGPENGGYTQTFIYNGKPQHPDDLIVYARNDDGTQGSPLTIDVDYTLTFSPDSTNMGKKSVTVTGIGDYEGSISYSYNIVGKSITASDIKIENVSRYTYTDEKENKPEVKIIDTSITEDSGENKVLRGIEGRGPVAGYDYYYYFENNMETGEGEVIIFGCDENYTGRASKKYEIVKLDKDNLIVTFKEEKIRFKHRKITVVPTYDGEVVDNPITSVKYQWKDTSGSVVEETELVEGTDYTVTEFENTKPGMDAGVEITGKGKYEGLKTPAYFWITRWLSQPEIRVDVKPQTYTGQEIEVKPEDITVTDTDNDYVLKYGEDYEIGGYENNKNEGMNAVLRIQGGINWKLTNGHDTVYMDEKTVYFEIKAATMQTVDINVDDKNLVYDGTPKAPTVTIGDGTFYTQPTDYTVRVTKGGVNAGTNTSTVTITPVGNGKLKGHAEDRNYSIKPAPLGDTTKVTMNLADSSPKVYSGNPIQPKASLKFTDGYGKQVDLVEGTDYDLSWSNNINAGTGTVTATGKGNFTGSVSCNFEISKASFTGAVVADIPDQTYKGSAFNLLPAVTINGRTLSANTDYDVSYSNNINAGTATIVVTGKGNYESSSVTKEFTILPQNIGNSQVRLATITPQTYTGQPIMPGVTLTYNGATIPESSYRVDYSNNQDATTQAVITITASNNTNFTGTRTEHFTISRRSIADNLTAENLMDTYTHTGDAITDASIQMHYVKADESIDTILVEDRDYKITYSNNIEPGEATITVEGLGNYTGTNKFTFKILGDLSNRSRVRINKIPDQTYTGSEIDASDMVVEYQSKNGSDGWKELTKELDYTVTYTDNIEVGTARAVIHGNGFYTGDTPEQTFQIVKKNLDTVTEDDKDYVITGIDKKYVYTGEAIEPAVSISYFGKDLIESTDDGVTGDYVVSYGENTNAGEGTVTITGCGKNFTGTHIRRFTIEPYDITSESGMAINGIVEEVVLDNVKALDDDTRTDNVALDSEGHVVQTNISVTYASGTTLTLVCGDDKDYSVSYEKNDDVGVATITFTGHGNYKGTMTRTFAIRGDLANETSTKIADIPDFPYTPSATGVSANTPVPEVTYRGKTLAASADGTTGDYSVSYSNNENVGDTATVTVTAVVGGNFVNAASKTFTIIKRELKIEEENSDITIEGLEEGGYEYTGEAIRPAIRVLCKGVALVEGRDYTIDYKNNLNVPAADAEEADLPTITITAKEDSNYTGEIILPFIINARQVSAENVEVGNVKEEYGYDNGNPIVIPHDEDEIAEGKEVTVTYVKGGLNIPLVEDTDYTMEYIDNHQIGNAIIRITGINNYEGVLDKTFRIMGDINEGMEKGYISLDYDENVPYGIVAVYPKLIFTDTTAGPGAEPKILEEGEDFEIVEEECSNNIHVASKNSENPPTVTVQGINCYKGKVTRTYTIVPKDLSTDEGDITASFSVNGVTGDSFVYTGSAIEPQIKLYNHGAEMEQGVDYTLGVYQNNINVPAEDVADSARPGIKVVAIPNGNYVGSKTMYFDIEPRPIDGMSTEITDGEQVYNRQEKKPSVRLYYTEGGQEITVPASGYDITYANNLLPAEANAQDAPTYTITGKGNYTGTISRTFAIAKESLAADDFNITAKAAAYTGSPVTSEITRFEAKDGTELIENRDYIVKGFKDNTQAGTGYIVVEGLGTYTGEREVPFDIIPAKGKFHIDEIPAQTYNTKQIKPEIVVWLEVDTDTSDEGLRIDLSEDDYEVTYGENTNAGTGTVKVVGTGNFAGTAEASFAIEPKDISTKDDGSSNFMELSPVEDQLFTGAGVRPALQLLFKNDAEGINSTLEEGKDYRVIYESNVKVGTGAATIEGMGNYTGTLKTTFRILGNMELATVEKIPVQDYTGSAITPKPIVSFAGELLTEGKDYTLSYKDNIERGTATITITAITGPDKWYGGVKEVTFDIAREFSESTTVLGVAPAYVYTGNAIFPSVVLRDEGALLSPGTDYIVSYSDNTNVGEVTITITGINKYTGTMTVSFRIIPQSVGRADVSAIADQVFDGKKKEPPVTVVNGSMVLRQNTDYTVQYDDSTSPGQGKVYIRGIGNYTGTKIVNYNVIVPKVEGVKASKYTKSSVTFSWKKNAVVDGYEIYNSSNRRAVQVSKNSQTSATVSKLSAATSSTFRVRAYVIRNGRYYYSDFTSVKGTTAPKSTKITSLVSTKPKKVVVKWKKVSGATGYQVYRSTSKKGKYKRIATTKKLSYTDKKATKGKKYYYKVRAYKKVSGSNYYSSYSSPKSVKAMK